MVIEGVLLTGGASRRMGTDKAHLMVDGEPLAENIARSLRAHCSKVTVLGRDPIDGCGFLADQEEFAGPLIALSRFTPAAGHIFVASCDLPRFEGGLITLLSTKLNGAQAVLPEDEGHLQPLCAIYTADSWITLQEAVQEGKKSLMAWLDRINYRTVSPGEISEVGIDPRSFRGANSPEELAQLLVN